MASYDWGPWLDFGAVWLPTILGVVGVALSMETPHLTNWKKLWAVRCGLICIGLFVGWVTWAQQQHARQISSLSSAADKREIQGNFDSLKKQIAAFAKTNADQSAAGGWCIFILCHGFHLYDCRFKRIR